MISQCCIKTTRKPLKYKPVTHVIFDLDGTLINSEGVYAEALQKTIEGYGIQYTPDLFRKIVGSSQQDLAKFLIKLLNIDTTVEEFLKIFTNYAKSKLGDLDLMPGAEKLVKHLSNNRIPIAIATSSRQESFELKTKKYADLFSLFGHMVCGGTDPELKVGKPAPDIFLLCASRFSDSPNPAKCLVFEDSGNGVKAAVAAGMQVVMIPDEAVPYELFGLPPLPPNEPPVFPQNLDQSAQQTDDLELREMT